MKNIKYLLVTVCMIIISGCGRPTPVDKLINEKASLPGSFSISDLHQKVLSSFSNKKYGTTSILYSDSAADSALNKGNLSNAKVFSLTLVTWRQQADPHWFGAKIPGDLLSVERLSKRPQDESPAYQKLSGKELLNATDTAGNSERIKFILSQKPLILP